MGSIHCNAGQLNLVRDFQQGNDLPGGLVCWELEKKNSVWGVELLNANSEKMMNRHEPH